MAPTEKAGVGMAGVGVDSHGGPVIDPTANVLALVEAQAKRQADLDTQRLHYEGLLRDLQEKLTDTESRRVDALRLAEASRANELRAIDASSIALAAAEARNSADVLRTMVSNAASSVAVQREQDAKAYNERFTRLEQTQYEARGQTVQKQERRQETGVAWGNVVPILAVILAALLAWMGGRMTTQQPAIITAPAVVPVTPIK